jgi:hypothetical protein
MRRKNLFFISILVLPVIIAFIPERENKDTSISTVKTTSVQSVNGFYISNKAPLLPLHFIKLPIGSIKPEGWIRKCLELQRDGLTGHLGEISAWLDKKNNAWYSGNGTGDHGWEEVPYWLKGYGDLGYLLQDPAIIRETRTWLEKVFQSQRADGYFGPAIIEKENQNKTGVVPDLWPNMIMLWCMQSYYDYSQDPRVLTFMTKYFKWQLSVPDEHLLTRYWEKTRGGDNLYSIYWLYNRTGEPWLLELAQKIHRVTDNWAQPENLPNWHNVNIAQCFREPATYFMQAKDSGLMKASYSDFNLVRQIYGQVPGGMFGADENARKGYMDPRQAVETCGMVEQMASDEIMAGITGDPFWADHCEEVAFNTFPAAVMPDFKGLRYLTAPNMVVSDSKNHSPGIQNDGPFLMMNPFSSRCCQHNHAQGWPYYAEHLFMATPDNGLAAMLYNSCTVTAKAGNGQTVELKEVTHYPFDEDIQITVNIAQATQFPLYLRIPEWSEKAEIYINGKLLSHEHQPATFTRIDRIWKNKDVIKVTLPKHLSVKKWEENKNSVSVAYGPLTFSLKIKEEYRKMNSKASAIRDSKWQENADESKWPSYEIFPAGNWNYGLLINDAKLTSQFTVIKKKWPADDFPFTQQFVPIEIKAKGKQIPTWKIDQYGLCDILPESPVAVNTSTEEIRLIPMGAARLRISAFPVVK